ncbi:MAG: hypothetical protein AVDCRST_MAG36-1706 [uncultured Nocardioidaceae bacterium]|uniref:Uncharacterized protein n=1 Tax=uncultured Nocardioidaceae bacterium TaxID=253824 RepID=A0A6J4M3B9_9ACTN|nr:MAG: hypothetical protein AVDCRST_MAG36-1706 [uncultured Nocardioidaceae bacterium]
MSTGAALVVAGLLLSVWWLAQPRAAGFGADPGGGTPGSPGAGTPASPGAEPADPSGEPPVGRDPVLVEGGVRIDRYAVRGSTLVLHHTTGVPECYGEVALGDVEVGADAVTVTLRSVPPPEPAQVCIDLAVLGTTVVDLGEPLDGRAVHDGSFRPAVEVARGGSPDGT